MKAIQKSTMAANPVTVFAAFTRRPNDERLWLDRWEIDAETAHTPAECAQRLNKWRKSDKTDAPVEFRLPVQYHGPAYSVVVTPEEIAGQLAEVA